MGLRDRIDPIRVKIWWLRVQQRVWTVGRLLVILSVIFLSAALLVGIAPTSTVVSIADDIPAVDADEVGSFSNETASLETEPLNQTAIQQAAHKRVNEARVEEGLPPLHYSNHLSSGAANHSERMANNGRLFHSDLTYGCQASGENVLYTFSDTEFSRDGTVVDYNDDEEEIGRGMVNSWLNSSSHRENILDPAFRTEGIGIAIVEDDEGRKRVYATQVLC